MAAGERHERLVGGAQRALVDVDDDGGVETHLLRKRSRPLGPDPDRRVARRGAGPRQERPARRGAGPAPAGARCRLPALAGPAHKGRATGSRRACPPGAPPEGRRRSSGSHAWSRRRSPSQAARGRRAAPAATPSRASQSLSECTTEARLGAPVVQLHKGRGSISGAETWRRRGPSGEGWTVAYQEGRQFLPHHPERTLPNNEPTTTTDPAAARGPGAARARHRHPRGRPPRPRRSTPACRPLPKVPVSAPRTSSSPMEATPTSARPRTAPRPEPRRTPTAASPRRCRSVPRSRSMAPASRGRWSTTRGSPCSGTARRTRRPAPTTTSRWSRSIPPTSARSTRRSPSSAGRPESARPAAGQQVYTYGNSSLRGGITQLSPKNGLLVEATPGGWSYTVYTVTPGIPGDSGSAFLNATRPGPRHAEHGRDRAAARGQRRRRHRQRARLRPQPRLRGLQLVNGTEPFKPKLLGQVPLG